MELNSCLLKKGILLLFVLLLLLFSCTRIHYNHVLKNIKFNDVNDTIFSDGINVRITQDSCIVFSMVEDNMHSGIVRIFNYKSNTEIYGEYENGEKSGIWSYFNKDGVLIRKEYYSNGDIYQLIYYKNGEIEKVVKGLLAF